MKIENIFLVYKTTNLINNKIYIGIHETEILDDDYLGSGLNIQRAINKYGEENFKREILFYCESKEEMYEKEAEIVNESFLKRDDVYNIMLGGNGGWDHINNQYLDLECECGFKTSNSSTFAQHCLWCEIRNSKEEIEIRKEKVAWSKGLTKETNKVLFEKSERIKEETKIKTSNSMKGLVRIHHPETKHRTAVKPDKLDEFFNKGYIRGAGKYNKKS